LFLGIDLLLEGTEPNRQIASSRVVLTQKDSEVARSELDWGDDCPKGFAIPEGRIFQWVQPVDFSMPEAGIVTTMVSLKLDGSSEYLVARGICTAYFEENPDISEKSGFAYRLHTLRKALRRRA